MDLETFAQHIKNRNIEMGDLCDVICDLYGIAEKKPLILKDSYYKKCDGIKIYRGLDCDKETYQDYVEKFAFGEMFFINRLAAMGQGYYFSDKKNIAAYFTNSKKIGLLRKPIISAKVMPNARLVESRPLNTEFRAKLPEIRQALTEKFADLLNENDVSYLVQILDSFAEPMIKAIILGYDGLVRVYASKKNGTIYLIFNRGVLMMSETEILAVKKEVQPYIQFD